MDTRKIEESLKIFTDALPSETKPFQVIIFGSQNDGSAQEDSDIDVLVVSDYFEEISEDNRLDILYKASRFISPEIHPWGVTTEELAHADKQSTLGSARKIGTQITFST
ncbi:MAG: hypothetical protein COY80_04040 [Candidatus Pacebacteria bacterium CG_4_10_14_0_8_um_filter_42_14]|nr:MAG: hypothetical protein COY80_04040 [Candidatus Pacebacteria bacterium CG_4_10_14_0_8_um_filter_42_14]